MVNASAQLISEIVIATRAPITAPRLNKNRLEYEIMNADLAFLEDIVVDNVIDAMRDQLESWTWPS